MKLYVEDNSFFLVGKVAELLDQLADYTAKFRTVKELIAKSLN